MSEYYVYALCDPRKPVALNVDDYLFNFEPFYIGQGKNDRCLAHLKNKGNSNPLKINKIKAIRNLELEPIIVKIKQDLTQLESLILERQFIAEIGTQILIEEIKFGSLTNATSGGEHCNHNIITKQKISEASKLNWQNKEYRNLISAKVKESHSNEKLKERFRLFAGKHHTDEAKLKISQGHIGKPLSDTHKRSISETLKGSPLSEERKLALSNTVKNTNSPSKYSHWVIQSPDSQIFKVECVKLFCEEHNLSMPGLQKGYKRTCLKGKSKGWSVLEKVNK